MSPTNLAPAAAIFLKETQTDATTGFKPGSDIDEMVALAGQTDFRPDKSIHATKVLINGIRIPYVHPHAEDIEDVHDPEPLGAHGQPVRGLTISAERRATGHRLSIRRRRRTAYPYKRETFGDFEGEIRFPLRAIR